jgi:hypothetical protein
MAQITYTNKETLNSQPSIADKNKVTSSDMNEIKSVVNTNYGEVGDITNLKTDNKQNLVNSINELKEREVYSTSEVKTNKVWINNEPIYRKVVQTTTSSSAVAGWTNLSKIDDIDLLINISGYINSSSNIKTPVPRYESTNYYIQFLLNNGYIQYRMSGFLSLPIYLIIEYTKTTD